MDFGQIRNRLEGVIGADVNAATLAGWIDEAQAEIARYYGKRQRVWYPPPLTYTASNMHAGSTSVLLEDTVPIPEAPDSVVLGDGETYEIADYTSVAAGSLLGLSRGRQETEALSWNIGTPVREVADAGVEYDLPSDLITVHEVRDVYNRPFFKYQISKDGKLTFHLKGMYYLSYTTVPEAIDHTDNSSEPEVHRMFHNSIVQFCHAKYWESIAEGIPGEENKAISMRQRFERDIQEIAAHLNRIPNQQYTIGFKIW